MSVDMSDALTERLTAGLATTLHDAPLEGFGARRQGKVRDIFTVEHGGARRLALVTTDRLSAFDRVLGLIPCKGQILTELSAWWFAQTEDIVQNHLIARPDPNIMLVHEATPLPVEIVVRGHITGVTSTSLWTRYAAGDPRPYGLELPAGLTRNAALPEPVITPTTKAQDGAHDERLTREELLTRGLVDEALYEEVERVALALFRRGQERAREAGLILVDTKYEFGLRDDALVLIDELHTPDSSRYWIADSFIKNPDAPEHLDKEFIRMWFAQQEYRGDGPAPTIPDTLRVALARRYAEVATRLTGTPFAPAEPPPTAARLQKNLTAALRAEPPAS